MKKFLSYLLTTVIISLLFPGCNPIDSHRKDDPPEKYSRVLTLVSIGTNSIDSYLLNDIKEMTDIKAGAYVPARKDDHALLVIGHHYDNPPCLVQFTSKDNKVVRDTVKIFDNISHLTTKGSLAGIFDYIKIKYPSDHYGMIYSSHGSGWLPEGYYKKGSVAISANDVTKSIGSEYDSTLGKERESEIYDFLNGVAVHFDYIMMDACLMGGIECAYEWRNSTDLIALSAAEIMADGLVYKDISRNLLLDANNGPLAVCRNFYEYYQSKTSRIDRTATIALVDCRHLDELAEICGILFDKYRSQMASVNPYQIQGFFRYNRHYFYDLYDIMEKSGASKAELEILDKALERCILYKNATERIVDEFDIRTFCGLSMYLPCNGNRTLDDFYKKLAWNKATGLVK